MHSTDLTLPLYHHSLAPHLQASAGGNDTLAVFGAMLFSVLLLVSSGSLSSSNPSLYKTTSSVKKPLKLGAWKVIVIALVSCYLVPLGSATDIGNKVCLGSVMQAG